MNLFSARLWRYYFAFLLIGFFTVMAGPLLPWFGQRFALRPSQTGALFFALFMASVLGALLSGFNPKLAQRGGLVLIAIASTMIALGGWPMIVAGFSLGGMGFGLAVAPTNMAVAEETAGDPGAVNLLNAFWGLGAFLAPLSLESHLPKTPLLLCLAAGSLAGAVLMPSTAVLQKAESVQRKDTVGSVLGFAVVAYLYIGCESAVGGWIPTLATVMERSWMPAASGYWGALVTGRLIAPAVLSRVSARNVMFGGVIMAAFAVFALWRIPQFPLFTASLIAGLGLAPLFPTLVALYSRRISKPAAGICFAIGSMGGAMLPWASGFAVSKAGGPRVAFALPLFALFVLFAMIAAAPRSEA